MSSCHLEGVGGEGRGARGGVAVRVGKRLYLLKYDVWLTVHRNSLWIRKTNWMSLFVFFISLLIVAQHVSGNHVPIIRS